MTLITRPRMQNELSELFNSFFNDVPTYWAPRMDLVENKDSYRLVVEVPGYDKKDIKVEFEDGILSVSGEKAEEKADENSRVNFREIRQGKFMRKVQFPLTIDSGRIKASYSNGMLTLDIPKSEKAKPTQIEVR